MTASVCGWPSVFVFFLVAFRCAFRFVCVDFFSLSLCTWRVVGGDLFGGEWFVLRSCGGLYLVVAVAGRRRSFCVVAGCFPVCVRGWLALVDFFLPQPTGAFFFFVGCFLPLAGRPTRTGRSVCIRSRLFVWQACLLVRRPFFLLLVRLSVGWLLVLAWLAGASGCFFPWLLIGPFFVGCGSFLLGPGSCFLLAVCLFYVGVHVLCLWLFLPLLPSCVCVWLCLSLLVVALIGSVSHGRLCLVGLFASY
ncbi:hypothetical protein [Pseudomonas syringae]|uniref:hypothetical protein n=1 Tax=Pseudomonas syringae TaxID=317 RepID=UPI001144CEE3|nr:hypothetical protein [Pseudomonas syringae]